MRKKDYSASASNLSASVSIFLTSLRMGKKKRKVDSHQVEISMLMHPIMQLQKHFSRFRSFQLNFIGACLKVIPNVPTRSAVLVRPLLLWLPVAACLQASVAAGSLSMGGNRNEVFEGEPSSSD